MNLPRRPMETVLHASFATTSIPSSITPSRTTRGLPRYVEQAFRDYLTCGARVVDGMELSPERWFGWEEPRT